MRADLVRCAILLSALSLGGCAFGTRRINLLYAESAPDFHRDRGPIAVAKFEDGREPGTERRLGILRNVYGIPTARITAEQDPILWISEGIVRALTSEGFTVEKIDSGERAAGMPTVSGRVTNIRTDGYSRTEVTIESDVAVESNARRLMAERCSGHLAESDWQSATAYQDDFAEAMDRFVTNCVPKRSTTSSLRFDAAEARDATRASREGGRT